MTTIEILAVILASCVLISALYWQVFNFVIIRQLRFQLFALRDEARSIAIERDLGESISFKYIEGFICKTLAISPSISLTSFILFCTVYGKKAFSDEVVAEAEKVKKAFEDEAPREFVAIRESTAKFSLLIMVFNAPWTMCFAALVGTVMVAFGKLTRAGLYRGAEKFVETASPEQTGCTNLA
jgi:hypothetical protein